VIKLQCSYERGADGSYRITPHTTWRTPNPKPFTLSGPAAQLWETLANVGTLESQAQHDVLKGLERGARARVLAAISKLATQGALEYEADFDLDTLAPPPSPQLRKMHLELTHRCNFACKGCYLGAKLAPVSGDSRREGSTQQWLELIRDAGELGCKYVTVTGGEPFIRPDILKLLEALSEQNISAEINTNGSPISERVAKALRTILVSSVEISIYGYSNTSAEGYTGSKAGFEASIQGVRNLVENGVPVRVKYFATQTTYQGYESVRELLAPLGVAVRYAPAPIHGDIFEGKLAPEGLTVDIERKQIKQARELPCTPSLNGLGIEPDGSVRACPKLTLIFGNAFEHGLKEVWQRSADLAAFREFWIEYCKSAGFVKGATLPSPCPANTFLMKEGGLADFRKQWETWREKERA